MRFSLFVTFFILYYNFTLSQTTAFKDVTEESGINHIFEVYQGLFGGGVVAFDYNNDGFEDLFITGGQGNDVLYKNNGDSTFSDITKSSGLLRDNITITTGVATADINKDGYIDIFLTTIASQKNNKKRLKL